MAEDQISLSDATGNFLTWCPSGFLPLPDLCRPLYVAPMLPDMVGRPGAAEPGQSYRVYSVQQAVSLFGRGSVGALMAREHFASCSSLPLFMTPLPQPTGSVSAVWRMAISGPATGSGTISLTILDMLIRLGVIVGTTATGIANGLVSAINANADLPFTAAVDNEDVLLTAKNPGPVGNWFGAKLSPNFGDTLPQGVGISISQQEVGAGIFNPGPAIPVMACPWDCIAIGTEDEAVVEAFRQMVEQNWQCGAQGDFRAGHVFHSRTDTPGQIAAYAWERNNPEETVIPTPIGYKYPGFMLAAAITSRFCCEACTDPSRPVQFDNGVMGSLYDSVECGSIWTTEENRAFDQAGVLIWDVNAARGVRDSRLVIKEPLTTYKYNQRTGQRDGAWTRVESRYQATYFIRNLGNWYRQNFYSTGLVNDGTPIPVGRRAVSPRIMQAAIISWARGQLGITADTDASSLERMIRVVRTNTPDNCDPNRVSVMIDLDLVNQLARIATSIAVTPERSCLPPMAIAA